MRYYSSSQTVQIIDSFDVLGPLPEAFVLDIGFIIRSDEQILLPAVINRSYLYKNPV